MNARRQFSRISRRTLPLFVVAGCALYSNVVVSPLIVSPTNVERGNDLQLILKKTDYLRALELASNIEARPHNTAADLANLGEAELASGRFDDARRHLRAAIDLQPFHAVYAQAAWGLSQVEYMNNNYDGSLDWAKLAVDHGLNILPWHLKFLQSLAAVDAYHFRGASSGRMSMRVGHPDVPRVDVRLNGSKNVSAVVDSGAVLSILSEHFAASLPVHSLGDFKGTFYGLLGEPISVHFGLVDRLELGDLIVENVPVAIMPDDKMRFLVSNNEKAFDIDFLLGANLLKEFRTELDFKKGAVTFTKLTPADRRPDGSQNLFYEQFRPVVRGAVNRHGWFHFVLDTGSEVTFLNSSQLGKLPVVFYIPLVHNATLQGLGGAKKLGTKIDNVEIGIDKWAGTFRDMPLYSSDNERSVGIIGENYLKNFKVTLDFGKMRVDLAL